MNDARLFPMQLREIRRRVGGVIDVFAFQSSGASWFPMCYEYPAERRAELSLRKRLAKFAYTARSGRLLGPVVSVPFAGPPCFLDQALFDHNREMEQGIFPDQQQAVDWLSARGIQSVTLLPGDAWDAQARTKDPDPAWRDFSFADRWPYLEAYAQRRQGDVEGVLARYPPPSWPLWEPFAEYFSRLLTMSPYFNSKIAMRVGFEVHGPAGGSWAVDFRPGQEEVSRDMGQCSYRFRFEDRWLPSLLDGTTRWEDFFLSLRFEASRDPDVYNDHLLGLLKFAEPAALGAVETFESGLGSDETITIEAEGRMYRVSRFCPHAGNDLLDTGEILTGGILTCLAHHYEFDLSTGRALNGDCPPLHVERLN
ncbi:MAG: hypothetical protein NVSMB32_10340 [Actinomycetota bacterium]